MGSKAHMELICVFCMNSLTLKRDGFWEQSCRKCTQNQTSLHFCVNITVMSCPRKLEWISGWENRGLNFIFLLSGVMIALYVRSRQSWLTQAMTAIADSLTLCPVGFGEGEEIIMLTNSGNHCENGHLLDPTHSSHGPGDAKLAPLDEREEQRQGCPNVPCCCFRNAVFNYSEGHSTSASCLERRAHFCYILCYPWQSCSCLEPWRGLSLSW